MPTRHPALVVLAVALLLSGGLLLRVPRAAAISLWRPAPALATPRYNHQALPLPDGRVFFLGPSNYGGTVVTGELYDPSSGSPGLTAPLPSAQGQEAPVLLPGGKVLVSGGGLQAGIEPSGFRTIASAQVYDLVAGTWTPVAPMTSSRLGHTATLLQDGTVLVAGGNTGSGTGATIPGASAFRQAERYDPRTNRWSPTGLLQATHSGGETATRLRDGRVLLIGGLRDVVDVAPSEIYDPATNSWTLTSPPALLRMSHTATLLADGRVLVVGGIGNGAMTQDRPLALATAEIYDPRTDRWAPAGTLRVGRIGHTATLLRGGHVLVVGGTGRADPNAAPAPFAEEYDPTTGKWTAVAGPTTPRRGHTATRLADGQVLVAGGQSGSDGTVTILATAEVYAPATTPEACFPQTGKCVRGPFLTFWQANGALALNGYPLSEEFTQTLEDGKPYIVQYFERVRLEYHPENPPPYDVLLGQFGRRILQQRTGQSVAPAATPVPGQSYFPQTGHNLGGSFLQYWQANGGLMQFGFPLSEVITETLEDGQPYQVQYFERARFEYHPENAPPWDILLGQFGPRVLTGTRR